MLRVSGIYALTIPFVAYFFTLSGLLGWGAFLLSFAIFLAAILDIVSHFVEIKPKSPPPRKFDDAKTRYDEVKDLSSLIELAKDPKNQHSRDTLLERLRRIALAKLMIARKLTYRDLREAASASHVISNLVSDDLVRKLISNHRSLGRSDRSIEALIERLEQWAP